MVEGSIEETTDTRDSQVPKENGSNNYIYRESSSRNEITSPPQRGVPRIMSNMSSPFRQPKSQSIALNENIVNYSTKASLSKFSSPTSLSFLASKSNLTKK